jgi:O-acetyl-ADP-ribose deacetylase (regulator of RNase III)
MIRWTTGNILDSPAEALVNTVNCVGVMGRGIALQFKAAFPKNFTAYAAACDRGEVQPGRMFVFDLQQLTSPRYIINFPTKRHWRGKSRIEDIESGLHALSQEIRERKIKSIAIPPLGSGLGGLDWKSVRPLIERALAPLSDVSITVFEPSTVASTIEPNRSTNVPTMTAGRAALVALIDRYIGAHMDPSISLLEIHKLMYFLQRAGEVPRLRYVKGPYGPYAENLRHVLRDIEGHLVSGYGSHGEEPDKPIELVPGALADAQTFLVRYEDTRRRLEDVRELVAGFETSFGLELLATVHWVMDREGADGDSEIERATYAWNARKQRFAPEQIRIAAEQLRMHPWVLAAHTSPSAH